MEMITKLEKELKRLEQIEPPRMWDFWEWKDNTEQQRMIRGRIGALKLVKSGKKEV